MKLFKPCSLLLLALVACGAETLDGGSNSGTSGSSGSPRGSEVPDKPLEGTVAQKPFTPKSIEIQYSEANQQWFFTVRNYELACGVSRGPTKPVGSDKQIAMIGKLDAKAGTFTIAYGDGHGASFQSGVYEAGGPDPDYTEAAKEGVLVLDAWSETPGATVTGALRLKNDESEIAGTFTATVCKSR